MDQQELRNLENMCIQECAPWCAARCPVHVDVRAMNAAVVKGDFPLARQIFLKAVPFPGIISHVCDHPCQNDCRRKDAGDAIAMRGLEKAILNLVSGSESKLKVLPKKPKRIAVVGAGLSGLTASLDLAKKGYEIVLFEAGDRLGGSVWDSAREELPAQIILDDLKVLEKVPLTVRLNTALGKDVFLSELQGDFDAVYIGIGSGAALSNDPEVDSSGRIPVDDITFETGRTGVFAGGSAVNGSGGRSPIRSISDGRRAAISIDRFLQKVSLTASRENEGSYETRLFTSLKGIDPLPRVPISDLSKCYSQDESIREAKRCLQCECMECVKVCDFLAEFKGYPRKYIRQIYNNLSIVMGHRHGNKLINSCSFCGLCKEVCPEDLHMGDVCKAARMTMVTQGKMPPSAHEFALRDMEFSNSNHFALARHEPGMQSSAFLFFPGCQLAASSPESVQQVYTYLRERLQGGVGLMLRCCGAPADWSGRQELFGNVFQDFESQWLRLGSPKLILACSTCYSEFKSRLPGDSIVSLWEIIDRSGLPPGKSGPKAETFAIHDPCTSRQEAGIHTSVRSIAQKLGLDLQELSLSQELTECCGFGGLMRFANREIADLVVERRIHETSANLLTYCAMCRDSFASHGKPAWHILDLLFGESSIEDKLGKRLDYSQRRENRFQLKTKLLKDLWGEQRLDTQRFRHVKLYISDEVRELMEKRMILEEDLREVIDWAEKNQARLVHKDTGHFLAHYRPNKVTYWVEYSPHEDGYMIYNTYCHRMEVLEEIKP